MRCGGRVPGVDRMGGGGGEKRCASNGGLGGSQARATAEARRGRREWNREFGGRCSGDHPGCGSGPGKMRSMAGMAAMRELHRHRTSWGGRLSGSRRSAAVVKVADGNLDVEAFGPKLSFMPHPSLVSTRTVVILWGLAIVLTSSPVQRPQDTGKNILVGQTFRRIARRKGDAKAQTREHFLCPRGGRHTAARVHACTGEEGWQRVPSDRKFKFYSKHRRRTPCI